VRTETFTKQTHGSVLMRVETFEKDGVERKIYYVDLAATTIEEAKKILAKYSTRGKDDRRSSKDPGGRD